MEGKDGKGLADSSSPANQNLVANFCTSNVSEAAMKKQDVVASKTYTEADLIDQSLTGELKPVGLNPSHAGIALTY